MAIYLIYGKDESQKTQFYNIFIDQTTRFGLITVNISGHFEVTQQISAEFFAASFQAKI